MKSLRELSVIAHAALKAKSKKASASFTAAISILLSVTLMFTGVRVYQITSAAAAVQEKTDAAALAAEAQVAKFYSVANTCDTAILAMNATQYVLWGSAIVVACTGNVATSAELIKQAHDVGKARSKFSEAAKKGLNAYQTALPLLAAASSVNVYDENELDGEHTVGLAVLVPMTGSDVTLDTTELEEADEKAAKEMDDVQEQSKELQDIKNQMDKLNAEAYGLDCGSNPSYCLYERAWSLSSISSANNPFYSSADAWDFNVAFNRSLAYFQARAKDENPSSQESEREKAKSYLRKDYYEWVVDKLKEAKSSSASADADSLYDWPEIHHDTEGFKNSERYNEAIYPITEDDSGKKKMHSNANLACAKGYTSKGSASDSEGDDFETCEECEFSTSNVGSIGSATTNTNTGFEHYFQKIRDLKEDWGEQKQKYDEKADELRDKVSSANDMLDGFLSAAKKARIEVNPPGRDGSIAVSLTKHGKGNSVVENLFVHGGDEETWGLAVAGAKLKEDKDESGLALLTKRLEPKGDNLSGAPKAWKSVLQSFGNGGSVGGDAIDEQTSDTKTVTSKIASFAKDLLMKSLDKVGLSPADWSAKKPYICNTEEVVSGQNDAFSTTYSSAQNLARESSSSSTDFMSAGSTLADKKFDSWVEKAKWEIAAVDIPIIGEVKVEIEPKEILGDSGIAKVKEQIAKLQDIQFGNNGVRSWE
ncbi:MAG: hypothetical protein Q3982_06175 [Phoenicibacter congonensis]|uniref:Molybdenum cofactor biosynthesis enzyme n=1 Tax=Phoenicibacter congonensis TaxID=1944646 RepID=A0AA43U6E4_9ACTN|nr:hypothetical protein [Phoenicibacter congonensis]